VGLLRLRLCVALGLLASSVACDAVLGLGQFTFDASVGDAGDASDECIGPNGCWACTPTTNDQFLNSCGGGQCIGFDSTRVTPFLLPDGGLPPLPDIDAGSDAAPEAAPTDSGGD